MYLESLMKLIILLLTLCDVAEVTINGIGNFDGLEKPQVLEESQRIKRFIFYRANFINERNCECPSMFNCNCCENVTLLLIKTQRKLCGNFMYQRNGLNIDISLDTTNLRTRTVNNYRPLKICTSVPGSLFSLVCLNLLELNAFPRSLTVCPQFVIITKHQEWRINYTCVSIATELPMVEEPQTAEPMMMPLIMTTRRPMSGMLVVSPTGNQSGQGSSMIPSTTARPTMPPARPSAMPPARPSTMPPAGPPAMSSARPPTMSSAGPPSSQVATTPSTPSGGNRPDSPRNQTNTQPARLPTSSPRTNLALIVNSPPSPFSDRIKHFPCRLPPAYAALYADNSTSTAC